MCRDGFGTVWHQGQFGSPRRHQYPHVEPEKTNTRRATKESLHPHIGNSDGPRGTSGGGRTHLTLPGKRRCIIYFRRRTRRGRRLVLRHIFVSEADPLSSVVRNNGKLCEQDAVILTGPWFPHIFSLCRRQHRQKGLMPLHEPSGFIIGKSLKIENDACHIF